ncbi:MAG: MFS transporter [Proteobacteria bacterium]|nr:MFS transporter [Pseudomonadota bacterium]
MTHPAPAADKALSFKRVLSSAAIGQFVEWYDFVIYAYSAATIAKLFFPAGDPAIAILATFAIYSVGFLARPVGGYIFGTLGDKIGRRRVLSLVILLMGSATVGIGLLPTYAQIGILAPILLIVCRLLQGLSAAGETVSSNSFVAEHAPPRHRGRFVSFTFSFSTAAPVAAAIVVLAFSNGMPAEDYQSWGWRIPFILGGPLALIGLYIRRIVDESPAFEQVVATAGISTSPLREAATLQTAAMVRAFALAAFSSLGFYSLSGYFVTYLVETGLDRQDALLSNGLAMFIAFVSFWGGGELSDRYGRKPVVLSTIVLSLILTIPAFMLASSASFGMALLGQTLLGMNYGFFWGAFGIAVVEMFPARTRVTGATMSFNIGYTLFGGTAPFIGTWLLLKTADNLSPAYYIVAVSALALFAAVTMRETAGGSMADGK